MADSHYCPMCGVEHGGDPEPEKAEIESVEEMVRADVEIARINAERDVKLAKIQAGILDAERDEELAHAEGKAEGMREVLETVVPDPEPVPEPEPIVVIPDDPEPSPDVVEPPEHESGSFPESKPRAKPRGLGMW